MTKRKIKTNSGFVALISTIIISAIILLIATNLSLTGFYGRFDILDRELKEKSSALAEACVDAGILKLANDIDYVLVEADHSIPVGTENCNIYSLSNSPPNIIITAKGNYNNIYFTTLEVTISSEDLSIISWKEI